MEKVGPQLTVFELRAPGAPEAAEQLFSLLKNVPIILLELGGTCPEVANVFPEPVVELHLAFDVETKRPPRVVADFLHQLRPREKRLSLRLVRLTWTTSTKFSWLRFGASHPNVAGKLLLESMMLQSERVQVQDQGRKSLRVRDWDQPAVSPGSVKRVASRRRRVEDSSP
ncbi:hypothetical protein CALCODRAFT_360441 [Calocera cornea HHB12733]|uniref:Uncharacterized protein n=1 Tax=Calocera cornea HHB12733 TaxID=1353952 RepID=A0A165EMK3_9BASI|nr:hypothetical protein CALCODRAFT_360441 [Calocera cornea HHB12733]